MVAALPRRSRSDRLQVRDALVVLIPVLMPLRTAMMTPESDPDPIPRAAMDGFDLIIAAVLVQFAMLLALILYAILVRIRHALRSRYRNKFRNIWNYLIPAYLSGDIDRMHIYFSLKSKDFPLFGEFIRPYLLDIKGDIHLKMASLLNYLGFHIYLKKLLGDRNPLRRAYAVHFLGLMQDPDTIALTRPALSDRSELVLYQAAEGLMRLQDIESMPKVLQRVSVVSRADPPRAWISKCYLSHGEDLLRQPRAMFGKIEREV